MKFENLYNLCGGLKFLVLFVGFSVCFSIFFFIKREKKDGDVFVSFVIGILIMIFFSGFLFILDNMVDYIGFILIVNGFFFCSSEVNRIFSESNFESVSLLILIFLWIFI